MARLNKRRRAELNASLAARVSNPSVQPSSGFVRSSTGRAKQNNADQAIPEVVRAYAPNPIDETRLLEGSGVRGRVSRGKFVPPPKGKLWRKRD